MLNQIDLMGRLTRDPELKTSTNGKPIALFSIACTRDYNREETDFIDIVAWGKTAEFVSKWFEKGQLVAITGRLQIRTWKDKDGNSRKSAEVVMREGYFCESRNKNAPNVAEQQKINEAAREEPYSDFDEFADDCDLPF